MTWEYSAIVFSSVKFTIVQSFSLRRTEVKNVVLPLRFPMARVATSLSFSTFSCILFTIASAYPWLRSTSYRLEPS